MWVVSPPIVGQPIFRVNPSSSALVDGNFCPVSWDERLHAKESTHLPSQLAFVKRANTAIKLQKFQIIRNCKILKFIYVASYGVGHEQVNPFTLPIPVPGSIRLI